ncbi:uncharacterized protein P884DRAFT_285794 [Thermothelomyces heterothallicus CBS 202.75]|uniref:uncharacterized protein n=1 Tax=Thermothelomyces heterothallicus CBS 202.75 TaxID=1149848 RepID=UPI003743BECB
MPPKTSPQTEESVLNGANESQDTLLVAHRLMMDFGVGLRSSSPAPVEAISLPSPSRSCPPSDAARKSSPEPFRFRADTEETRGTRFEITEQRRRSSVPESQDLGLPKGVLRAHVRPDWDAQNESDVAGDLNLPDTFPVSAAIDGVSRRRIMDSTQASTQSNAGRSYDKYYQPLSQGHVAPKEPEPPKRNSPEPRDVDGEDTGLTFDFANTVVTAKAVSPAQDDSGLVQFGNLAHSQHATSQKTESPAQDLPETPAPPQNPFRHNRSELLPTSQLFRGTQSSSPVKHASPTSSRPSPIDFPGNTISPKPVVSSPLKARGLRSSPTNDILSSPDNPVVPESSHDGLASKWSGHQPMTSYEPMHKSQERRSIPVTGTDFVSSEDEDSHDSILRRRRAKHKKEAALRQLTAITFPRPTKPEDVEVPATSQRRRTSQAEPYVVRSYDHEPITQGSETTEAQTMSRQNRPQPVKNQPQVDEDSTLSDVEDEAVSASNPIPSMLLERTQTSTMSGPLAAQGADNEGTSNGDAIPETSPTGKILNTLPAIAPSSELAPSAVGSTGDFQSSPPVFSTRSRKGNGGRRYPRVPSSSSTLSDLTSTPQLPSSNYLGSASTAPPDSPTGSIIAASSSPAAAQTKRRDARGRLPVIKTGSTESLRQAARVTRRGSNSTDELARSISGTPTFEQSLRVSRMSTSRSASRSGGGVMKPPTMRDQKLFDNMAFAISFQSRKPGESNDQYKSRVDFSIAIQRRIKQAGGRILEHGFDELFEPLSLETPSSSPASTADAKTEISLTPEGRTTGFTALIADGHSRKVKYMQALALGLPCIAARWVTTCLERNELVDWTPYLLCAGQSAFLGDAIRSRSLSPYDASTASLADIIGQREKLLEGSRILAVVKKSLEERKMAYVFLARVLGASLTRVHSVEQARAEIKAADEGGQPFDWVYVDGKPDEEALFARGSVGGKKRKRAGSVASSAVQPPMKRIRTLSDELVIQSLILGRLIEEGEMNS